MIIRVSHDSCPPISSRRFTAEHRARIKRKYENPFVVSHTRGYLESDWRLEMMCWWIHQRRTFCHCCIVRVPTLARWPMDCDSISNSTSTICLMRWARFVPRSRDHEVACREGGRSTRAVLRATARNQLWLLGHHLVVPPPTATPSRGGLALLHTLRLHGLRDSLQRCISLSLSVSYFRECISFSLFLRDTRRCPHLLARPKPKERTILIQL